MLRAVREGHCSPEQFTCAIASTHEGLLRSLPHPTSSLKQDPGSKQKSDQDAEGFGRLGTVKDRGGTTAAAPRFNTPLYSQGDTFP